MGKLSLEKIDDSFQCKRYYICGKYKIDDVQGLERDIRKKNHNHTDDPEFQKRPISESELISLFFLLSFKLSDLFFQFFKFSQLFLVVRFNRFEKIRAAFDNLMNECHRGELRNKC